MPSSHCDTSQGCNGCEARIILLLVSHSNGLAPSAATPFHTLGRDSNMRSQVTRQPDRKGTKKLLEQYGSQLVCVRYRYNEQHCQRRKTVELIIGQLSWHPKSSAPRDDALVGVRIGLKEVDLQRRVKQVGGRWNGARLLYNLG